MFYERYKPLLPRAVALVDLFLLGCVLSSCTMPELTQVSRQGFPTAMSCGDCHVEIYDEWKQSPHAMAFTNERFRRATDDYQFAQCIGCHAPEPAMVMAEPKARVIDRDIGVACVACHLDRGAMVGPVEPTGFARPHPIRVDRSPFENGTICGHCHQGTLAEWQAAPIPDKRDCRHCHMPAVQRKITQSTGLISKPIVAAEEIAPQHRHTFLIAPIDLAESPMVLRVERIGEQARVSLTNQIPHGLPAGDFGVRIVRIVTTGTTAEGSQKELGSWELTNSGSGSLPAGQTREWTVSLTPDLSKVLVVVMRQGRDGANKAELLRSEVPLR